MQEFVVDSDAAVSASAGAAGGPGGGPWLLKPKQAAGLLGVSRSTLYQLMARGEIPTVTIGRCRRIPVSALKAWVDAQAS